jgi:hypothetical protein
MKPRSFLLGALGMVVLVLLGMVLASLLVAAEIQGQTADGAVPAQPSPFPPEIYKFADDHYLGIGDPVTFMIGVLNREWHGVTWFDVALYDEVPAEFLIDEVTVIPPDLEPVIIGNRVAVTATSLAPGEWFAVNLDCTLVGPAEPHEEITNEPEHIHQGGLDPGIYLIQVYHASGPGSNQPYDLMAEFDG